MIPLVLGAAAVGLGLWSSRRIDRLEAARLQQNRRLRAAPAPTVFGFVSPSDLNAKIRRMGEAARALDAAVLVNVPRPEFRAAWQAWFASWNGYVDANHGLTSELLRSDEIADRLESFRLELVGWWRDYLGERRADGSPVPAPIGTPPGPDPAPAPPPNGAARGSLLPWWGWMVGGAVVLGAGYYAYRRHAAKHEAMTLRDPHPPLLPPGAPSGGAAVLRDPEPGAAVIGLERFAQDPRALIAYRPYDHPHLVPVPYPGYPHAYRPEPPTRQPRPGAPDRGPAFDPEMW